MIRSSWGGNLRVHLGAMLLLGLLISSLMVLPGCDGCLRERDTAQREEEEDAEALLEKRKKQRPLPDFETEPLRIIPTDPTIKTNPVKPGHWASAVQKIKANNFDFQADLVTSSVDVNGRPLVMDRTPFAMMSTRPAALPQGQTMEFESLFVVPRGPGIQRAATSSVPQSRRLWMQSKLRARRGGREVTASMEPTTAMEPYQFYMMVLSEQPDSFGFLRLLPSINPPIDPLAGESDLRYYFVVLPHLEGRVPLSSHPLTWTSMAMLVWDGVAPDRLTPAQQNAMLDWLHWGGQLVINGPASLDSLRGSFLEPYLPAVSVRTVELAGEDFSAINETWSLHSERHQRLMELEVLEESPLIGVELDLKEGGAFIPESGSLVAERLVGGGRIVVTSFSLNDRAIINWGSFDNFFNGCILRLPGRKFSVDHELATMTQWRTPYTGLEFDPRLTSTIRYFTRDIRPAAERARATGGNATDVNVAEENVAEENTAWRSDRRFKGYAKSADAGVGGWNDFSGASSAARHALKEAAGIEIPNSSFVVRVMAVYLVILVPVNWGFFWMIRRVEWAWIAAPMIAIVGGVAVVRLAQLDIGFVRSLTQVGVLEVQAGYPRGHLTRYAALYTSLSTTYDMQFDDPTGLAQPFAIGPDYRLGAHDSVKTVSFRRDRHTQVSGFKVDSNQTGMMHFEQMLDMGGAFRWQTFDDHQRLINDTQLALRDVGVLRGTQSGRPQLAWVGDLAPGDSAALDWSEAQHAWFAQWDESAAFSEATGDDEVRLRELARLASQVLGLDPGEVRMIGWIEEPLAGVSFRPLASQVVTRTLALVHLHRPELPPVARDENLLIDIRQPLDDLLDDDLLEEDATAFP